MDARLAFRPPRRREVGDIYRSLPGLVRFDYTEYSNTSGSLLGRQLSFISTEVGFGVTGPDVTGLPKCGVSP
jgi:hypothetical protein